MVDVLRPLEPPVGVNHEIFTFQNFPLHPVPVYTTGGASDLNTTATTKIIPVSVVGKLLQSSNIISSKNTNIDYENYFLLKLSNIIIEKCQIIQFCSKIV